MTLRPDGSDSNLTQVKFETIGYRLPPVEANEEINAHGAYMARRHLQPLLDQLQKRGGQASMPVVLQFPNMVSATSSYFKRTWLYLHRCSLLAAGVPVEQDPRDPLIPLLVHPFVTELSDEVRTEFRDVCKAERMPCIELDDSATAKGRVLGVLDPSLREALVTLTQRGHGSASDLHDDDRDRAPRITVNAWNNRLIDLMRLHLVDRQREGRNWIYRPILTEVSYG